MYRVNGTNLAAPVNYGPRESSESLKAECKQYKIVCNISRLSRNDQKRIQAYQQVE